MLEQPCPTSDASIGHRCQRQGRVGNVRTMHWQRWDGAGSTSLPYPYKYHPNEGKKRKRKRGKMTENGRETEKEREKLIVLREKRLKLRNTKTGDIDWET